MEQEILILVLNLLIFIFFFFNNIFNTFRKYYIMKMNDIIDKNKQQKVILNYEGILLFIYIFGIIIFMLIGSFLESKIGLLDSNNIFGSIIVILTIMFSIFLFIYCSIFESKLEKKYSIKFHYLNTIGIFAVVIPLFYFFELYGINNILTFCYHEKIINIEGLIFYFFTFITLIYFVQNGLPYWIINLIKTKSQARKIIYQIIISVIIMFVFLSLNLLLVSIF